MNQSIEAFLRAKFKKVRKTKGKNGVEYRVNCPFCKDDKKFKMYINQDKGMYNCFRNPTHSGMISDLFHELKELRFATGAETVERIEPLPEWVEPAGWMIPVNQLDDDHPAIQYLSKVRKRPFDKNDLFKYWGVMYCGQGKVFMTSSFNFDTSNTLIFPIYMLGRLVGWQARLLYTPEDLSPDECEAMGFPRDEDGEFMLPPKYYTSRFSKGRVLFNFDGARVRTDEFNRVVSGYDYVVVTEGVFDAMSVGPCAVATFGTGISEFQASLLKDYWKTVIVLLDPDGTDDATEELIKGLYRSVEVVRVKLAGYKDPGDTPHDVVWGQILATVDHHRKSRDTAMREHMRRNS